MEASWRNRLAGFVRENAKPVDKHGHQPRLYALARLVGAGMTYDDDVVFAAAYLHDLGVFIGHRPEDREQLARWNHVLYTCERAPLVLDGIGFPAEKTSLVLEVIRTHQPIDEPYSPEAVIVRDADILEQLGAVGILRAVAKVGRDTRYEQYAPVVRFLEHNLRELPSRIRLASTRALAEPKLALMREFLAAVEAESYGHLD